MPVRSLHSSVLKWPDLAAVDEAARRWATEAATKHPGVQRIGYFGSYAKDQWGVGSDLDIVAIVSESELPFEGRSALWDTTPLPVPADILVYTESEWNRPDRRTRFRHDIEDDTVWVFVAG